MLQLGQVLKGQVGTYRIARKLQESIWLAVTSELEQNVIVKFVDNFHMGIERDALHRFQSRTQHIRPLIDEVQMVNESEWPALILKWLEDDALSTSIRKRLTRPELRRVGLGILEALQAIHEDGYVHTDVKPENILVNFNRTTQEITDVQLADLDSTVHEDSAYAKDGDTIGTPLFRSPEVFLSMQWGTSTDVWSFGATMITLICGRNFNILRPDVAMDHDDYDVKIMVRQNQIFGPFPATYQEIANTDQLEALTWVVENTNGPYLPFRNAIIEGLSEKDKEFLHKIMKLDPRDRPTIRELLDDEWFTST